MEKQVKDDIKAVLTQVLDALDKRDGNRIAELSNHTIHNASIYQDEFSLSCAVMVYALSKLVMRCSDDANVCATPREPIQQALSQIENEKAFEKALQRILTTISKLDAKMSSYIEEVIHKARVKKGSALWKHGISVGKAAELLGVTHWDLQTYTGQTLYLDEEKARTNLKEKIAVMRKIFP